MGTLSLWQWERTSLLLVIVWATSSLRSYVCVRANVRTGSSIGQVFQEFLKLIGIGARQALHGRGTVGKDKGRHGRRVEFHGRIPIVVHVHKPKGNRIRGRAQIVVNGFNLLARWAPYLQSQTGRQGQG
jgi:hypothetical protein